MEVGQKIVCVDSSIKPEMAEEIEKAFQQWVVKTKHYTIREILENDGIVPSILLEEIHNVPVYFPKTIGRVQEPAFRISRFRELAEDEVQVEKREMAEIQ